MKSDIEDVTFVQRLYMRIELVSCLRIERGRDEDGVTSPFLVNFIQSSVILSNHKDFVLMLLPGEANQPVVEERQEGIANGADDHSPVLSDKLSRLREGIVAPVRRQRRRRRAYVWKRE